MNFNRKTKKNNNNNKLNEIYILLEFKSIFKILYFYNKNMLYI